jgi:hypothetical protein
VDPVPDPLLLRKSGSTGNRTRTTGSVARNSDHWTTKEALQTQMILKYSNLNRWPFLGNDSLIPRDCCHTSATTEELL